MQLFLKQHRCKLYHLKWGVSDILMLQSTCDAVWFLPLERIFIDDPHTHTHWMVDFSVSDLDKHMTWMIGLAYSLRSQDDQTEKDCKQLEPASIDQSHHNSSLLQPWQTSKPHVKFCTPSWPFYFHLSDDSTRGVERSAGWENLGCGAGRVGLMETCREGPTNESEFIQKKKFLLTSSTERIRDEGCWPRLEENTFGQTKRGCQLATISDAVPGALGWRCQHGS